MATHTRRSQESTGPITGPHRGTDRHGDPDHRYWRCRRCGLESTDPRLREGCFRCGAAGARFRARRPRRVGDAGVSSDDHPEDANEGSDDHHGRDRPDDRDGSNAPGHPDHEVERG